VLRRSPARPGSGRCAGLPVLSDARPAHGYPGRGFSTALLRVPRRLPQACIAARGRHIGSGSSSCTAVTPAAIVQHGLQLRLRSKRADDDRRGHPADGVVSLMQPTKSLALGGVSPGPASPCPPRSGASAGPAGPGAGRQGVLQLRDPCPPAPAQHQSHDSTARRPGARRRRRAARAAARL
jgi:hypothetical protein